MKEKNRHFSGVFSKANYGTTKQTFSQEYPAQIIRHKLKHLLKVNKT